MTKTPENILILRETFSRPPFVPDTDDTLPMRVGFGEPPPRWLPEPARSIWNDVLHKLIESGRQLGPLHLPMLAVFCERLAHYQAQVTAGQHVDAADIEQLRRLAEAFGMLPCSSPPSPSATKPTCA